jgi:predicted dehydrogenase
MQVTLIQVTATKTPNKVAILGGGFGLYGYLPAVCERFSIPVLLSQKYAARIQKRAELQQYWDRIVWYDDKEPLPAGIDFVIIAMNPKSQEERIKNLLLSKTLRLLILEKPIARSPSIANDLLTQLRASAVTFRIGYLFRFTPWARNLFLALDTANKPKLIEISWCFKADHFRMVKNTWKRIHSAGGGAIRFYGIHVIALLAEKGFDHVRESRSIGRSSDELTIWQATIGDPTGHVCKINLDSDSEETAFFIRVRTTKGQGISEVLFSTTLTGPFESTEFSRTQKNQQDYRTGFLEQLLDTVSQADHCPWYEDVITLWAKVEATNQHQVLSSPRSTE